MNFLVSNYLENFICTISFIVFFYLLKKKRNPTSGCYILKKWEKNLTSKNYVLNQWLISTKNYILDQWNRNNPTLKSYGLKEWLLICSKEKN